MSSRRHLEILHSPPTTPLAGMPPLVFVHGAYVGAWCWQDHFLPWFSDLGYDCYALSLSGHAGSGGREKLDHFGLGEFLADIARVAAPLHQPPVLIGHSLGGYLAQRYARKHPVAGLALLGSVAPWGLMNSLGHMMVSSPHLLLGLNQFQWHTGAMDIDLGVLKQLLFSHDTPRVGLTAFAARVQPESALALAELMMPQPWLSWGMPDLPVLVIGAGEDRIIPAGDVRATARAWGVAPEFLPGLGHALMCDTLWEHVALRLHTWLKQQFGTRG
ncbi:alpha/beta hydrolase [Silvimonas amylolytica]|uniref:Alpha/beta hydrolase n=1 Tax=Silvimonas amylolytica TaxID=449663 RepID=A0ABQ2PKQ3_9NEIS|nr:alpha/beta fold hydrolase [Silvimonas amylolytica]GGP26203.1 alpha/beta hydrolase [Silvimonas amylolytica]